jgi:hypothetical protein
VEISLPIRPHVKVLVPIRGVDNRMEGPTNEADVEDSSAVACKRSTLLGLAALNCSDDVDPAAPAASSSSLDGKELEDPSVVLCGGSVPGLEVISDDGSNSSSCPDEDGASASCRVSADAESATAAASSSTWMKMGEIIDRYRLQRALRDPRSRNLHEPPQKKSASMHGGDSGRTSDPRAAEKTLGREARHSH